MALLFFDGFDHCSTIEDTRLKWSGGVFNNSSVITFETGRLGVGRSIKCVSSYLNPIKGYTYSLPTARAGGVVGFAMRQDTRWGWAAIDINGAGNSNIFCTIYSGSVHWAIFIDWDGNWYIVRYSAWSGSYSVLSGPVNPGLSLGVWYYVEAKWTIGATGNIVVRVNGADVFNLSNLDNRGRDASNNPYASLYNQSRIYAWIASSSNQHYTSWIDDCYFCDDQAGANDFLGDVRIDAHYPNANGNSSQWTRSTGANQYATIDENAPDTTDYNSTSVVGNKDTLGIENFKNSGGTIYGVQTNLYAKKNDAGAGWISPVIRHNTTDHDGTSAPLSTDYIYSREIFTTNPGTSAQWSETDFNNAEFGYRKRA